jgi:hypothetical protein
MQQSGRHYVEAIVLLTALVVGAIPPPQTVHRVPVGTVTGRVVDHRGEPVHGALIEVRPGAAHGAVTEANGRFSLRAIPAGDYVFVARAIGYDPDVSFVRLTDEDSLDVLFRIQEADIPFPGTDHSRPAPEQLNHASALIARVLREPDVLSRLQRLWPDLQPRDTVLVWAAWISSRQDLASGTAPVFRVLSICSSCVDREWSTIEAGAYYSAATRHIRLGVRAATVGTARFEFCVGFAEPSDELMSNCIGSPAASMRVWYFERGPGDWERLELEQESGPDSSAQTPWTASSRSAHPSEINGTSSRDAHGAPRP